VARVGVDPKQPSHLNLYAGLLAGLPDSRAGDGLSHLDGAAGEDRRQCVELLADAAGIGGHAGRIVGCAPERREIAPKRRERPVDAGFSATFQRNFGKIS